MEGPRIRGELCPAQLSRRGREPFEVSARSPLCQGRPRPALPACEAGRSEESEAQVEVGGGGRASHPLLEAVLTPWLHPGTGTLASHPCIPCRQEAGSCPLGSLGQML